MEFSSCPICQLIVPSSEIERHANGHFADDDYARDLVLAQQIALIPSSPPRFAQDSFKTVCYSWEDLQSSSFGNNAKYTAFAGRPSDGKYASLVQSQSKETFCNIEGGLMNLLKNCLELDPENSVSILSGNVDHFQSVKSEDAGWGCGWRNIQMLSSHLLRQRQNFLFGGSGFVPDIPSLQRWLELAWENGFDEPGSDDFDLKIYGKRNWIGTTECATLFRSFGVRARIVDFCRNAGFDSSVPHLGSCTGGKGNHAGKRKFAKAYGPMDTFLSVGRLDLSPIVSSVSESCKGSSVSSENVANNHILIDWVWNYFSENKVNKFGHQHVVCSEKPPLYFQHHGHSRTIVGIQAKRYKRGLQQYNLLIFDPSENTRALEKSLRANLGWQKLIKRGAHTLKKQQYQLCYIEPGIAHGEELEKLKNLHSIQYNI